MKWSQAQAFPQVPTCICVLFKMSGRATSIGSTLAGGIQDIAALLPILGTEQCETHMGSALEAGYLYAAATPLSIFGSLGIVKGGVSILFSSISISFPKISITMPNFKPKIVYSQHHQWLGAKTFSDAGFKLSGSVASLIGIDGRHFKAETRLSRILEETHIDDPGKITVNQKSRKWNIMLIISTFLFSALGLTPYIAILLGPGPWRPNHIHLPWLYPALRTLGSCFATACCQFILQSRVVSLMKNRILFMAIDRHLKRINIAGLEAWSRDANLEWDSDYPAEQCLLSLERVLLSFGPLKTPLEDTNVSDDHTTVQMDTAPSLERAQEDLGHVSIPMTTLPKDPVSATKVSSAAPPAPNLKTLFSIDDLYRLRQEHFPSPVSEAAFLSLSWIILGFSLPAIVAGYIGCFTLVSASPPSNGPLIWLALEIALSILRILIWASNPSFDQNTEVTLGLKLTKHQPMVTTNEYNPYFASSTPHKRKPFALVPDHEFLRQIAPFTGPLNEFQKDDNILLYFTLTTNYGGGNSSESARRDEGSGSQESLCLLMTVFNVDMEVGVTISFFDKSLCFFDALVKYDAFYRIMEAEIQSEKRDVHPWEKEDDILFDSLMKYYHYIVGSFFRRDKTFTVVTDEAETANLSWKWNLSQATETANHQAQGNHNQNETPLTLTHEDQLYLNRGYEHQLKSKLVDKWSQWIVMDMGNLRSDLRNDCHEALKGETSKKAKWELTGLDVQLVWAWAWRELLLLELSLELEDILATKMELCSSMVFLARQDTQLRLWMNSEFEKGRRKRLERERGRTKERMEKALEVASDLADREGRSWKGDEQFFLPQWTKVIDFIDEQWSAGIHNRPEELKAAEDELKKMIIEGEQQRRLLHPQRDTFLEQLQSRILHEHGRFQHELEKHMMVAAVEGIRAIRADITRKELDTAYRYPRPDRYATAKFANLGLSSSQGKACSAVVYDALGCGMEALLNVVAKKTTRSIINVDPKFVASIPPNDHLLFLSVYGEGEEPIFVQENRDKWWELQTANSSIFYFTPLGVYGSSCSAFNGVIAHIFLYLAVPSAVRVRMLHYGETVIAISIQENGCELAIISDVPPTFVPQSFQPFVLQKGRHELKLVPHIQHGFYFVRDILIEFSSDASLDVDSASSESSCEGSIIGGSGLNFEGESDPGGITY